MKMRNLILFLIVITIVFSSVVFAITLTKEYTQKVELVEGVYGTMCLWDETNQVCLEQSADKDKIVFGRALVYGTEKTGVGPFDMSIFLFHNTLYRSTGMGLDYLKINCRNETVTKEGITEVVEKCDSDYNVKVSEHGGGSIVTETGIEINEKFGYTIYFNDDGSIKDLIMKLRESNDSTRVSIEEYNITYKLTEIIDRTSNKVWIPA